ncbi:MAG: metallophosphoesterase [Clostridiales bacterium]|nr:metallophosphoesterase [Clostridiales bacterium]
MKTLIVVSDTHGNTKSLEKLTPLIAENDYFIHLGDGVGDIRSIRDQYPEKTYFCAGNCDFFSAYPTEGVLHVEQVDIFYTHGHKYGVKNGLETLAQVAKSRGCEIAFYGHTHTPNVCEIDGVTLVNPGALRFVGDKPTYAYVVVNGRKHTSVLVGENLR